MVVRWLYYGLQLISWHRTYQYCLRPAGMRHWVNTERTLQTHRYKSLQTCNTTSVCRWELTPCSLVDADASVESVASVFRVVLLPNRKAADFSETLVPSYTASDSRTLIYRSSRWGSQISHTDVLWLVKTQFGKRKIKTRLWISSRQFRCPYEKQRRNYGPYSDHSRSIYDLLRADHTLRVEKSLLNL